MSSLIPADAYALDFKVRDYECDLQGVVNNANYMHYLEHARHEYLLSVGLDFAAMFERGIHLIVVRAELDYRSPLRSGDRFRVAVHPIRESRLKFAFHQQIRHLADNRLVMNAKVIGTAINPSGRPEIPPEVDALIPHRH